MDAGIFGNNLMVIGMIVFGGAVLIFGGKALVEAMIDKMGMLGVVLLIIGVVFGGGLLIGFVQDLTGSRESASIFDLLLALGKEPITIPSPFD